jgi:elongation factor P--(R)-beta-lysine ligase
MKSESKNADADFAPSAALQTLRDRALFVRTLRAFFEQRELLEVDTPMLSRHATVDRHIESFSSNGRWLHTSPEFAMKRLLCAGSGAIWQLCKVFRREESGRHHNPEFTMLEWYRPGFDHHALMDEIDDLLRHLGVLESGSCERLSYREASLRVAGFDPFALSTRTLAARAQHASPPPAAIDADDRNGWLDYWYGSVVSPALGHTRPCFIYDFPASQAALARVRGPVAERFELVWKGVELANGFHELADAAEQRARFEAEQAARAAAGQVVPPLDTALIAALEHGLPDCAGVAVGIDRLFALMHGLPDIASAVSFDWRSA